MALNLGSSYDPPVFWLWASLGWAADVVAGSNLLGAGGVGVAASRDNAGITLNPGLLGLHDRYDFTGLFRYGPYGGLGWGLSAMDSRTSRFVAVGFAYSGDRVEPPLTVNDLPGWALAGEEVRNVNRTHDFIGAISVPFADRRVSLGISGDLTVYDFDRHGDGTAFNGHAGLGIRPIDLLSIGISGRHLLPMGLVERAPEGWVGARIQPDDFAAELDAGWNFDAAEPMFAAGLDKTVGRGAFRGGWRFVDQTHAVTFGLGYTDSGGSIEYGLVLPLSGKVGFETTIHQVSVRFSAPAPIAEP